MRYALYTQLRPKIRITLVFDINHARCCTVLICWNSASVAMTVVSAQRLHYPEDASALYRHILHMCIAMQAQKCGKHCHQDYAVQRVKTHSVDISKLTFYPIF